MIFTDCEGNNWNHFKYTVFKNGIQQTVLHAACMDSQENVTIETLSYYLKKEKRKFENLEKISYEEAQNLDVNSVLFINIKEGNKINE